MRHTLTGDFWGLHKNMNCAFPLNIKRQKIGNAELCRFTRKLNYMLENDVFVNVKPNKINS